MSTTTSGSMLCFKQQSVVTDSLHNVHPKRDVSACVLKETLAWAAVEFALVQELVKVRVPPEFVWIMAAIFSGSCLVSSVSSSPVCAFLIPPSQAIDGTRKDTIASPRLNPKPYTCRGPYGTPKHWVSI